MILSTTSMFVLRLAVSLALSQVPNPGNSRSAGEPQTQTPVRTPDPPPLPPDVKTPDAPPGANPSGNAMSRTVRRLAPNCINAVFHACWSSPPQRRQPPQTAERKGAASREIGEFYLKRGNYRAAESRFHEAIQYNWSDARARYDLGQTLEKLNEIEEAVAQYRSYLDLQPLGPYAESSRQAVDRLTVKAILPPRH